MKVVHFAPFAPHRCGLYEAARDMVRADTLRGHEALLVDTGLCPGYGQRDPGKVGALDPRGGWVLETVAPGRALDADLWVCHDGVSDNLAARCQVPMVWMIHGRPLACFRPEQEGKPGRPFSIVAELATWPRVKALVTMWEEFVPYWSMVVPPEKLRCTGDPPIDRARYKPTGKRHELDPAKAGKTNLLICDSWRDDVDVFEVAVACLVAARREPERGIRVHFWAVEQDKQAAWQHVWRALDRAGALGEVHAREEDMGRVYRAMTALVSPHRIGVRTIGEALSCGLPVVAADGCRYTPWTGNPSDAEDMADAILSCLSKELSPVWIGSARAFDLDLFGERMEAIYEEALGAPAREEVASACA